MRNSSSNPRSSRREARAHLYFRPWARIPPKIPAGIQQPFHPFAYTQLIRITIILAIIRKHVVLELDPAAGLSVGKHLPDELGPVDNRAGQVARVDIVEGLGPGPGGFAVVDFELHVRGDPRRRVVLSSLTHSVCEIAENG